MHTIKNNIVISSAGIDQSNVGDYYVLWPKDPKKTVKKLHDWVRETYNVKEVGIIITDSHSVPLRRGTIGISLAHYGFVPLKDYRQEEDLFGRPFAVTQSNIVDSLAAATVLSMGEGAESTPIAVVSDLPFVTFTDQPIPLDKPFSTFEVSEEEDLYSPFFSKAPWEKGGGGTKS